MAASNTAGETELPPARYKRPSVQQHLALAGHAAARHRVEVARTCCSASGSRRWPRPGRRRACRRSRSCRRRSRPCPCRPARRWPPARWRRSADRRDPPLGRRGAEPPQQLAGGRLEGVGPAVAGADQRPARRRWWADSGRRRRCRPSTRACPLAASSARTTPSRAADEDQSAGRHRRGRLDGRLGRRICHSSFDLLGQIAAALRPCGALSAAIGRPIAGRRANLATLPAAARRLLQPLLLGRPAGRSRNRPPARSAISAEHLQVAVAGPGDPVEMPVGHHHADVARRAASARSTASLPAATSNRPEPSWPRKKMLSARAGRPRAGAAADLVLASTLPVSGSSFLVSSVDVLRADGVQAVVADDDVQVLGRVLPQHAAVVGRQGREPFDLRADEVQGLVGALQIHGALPAADVAVARADTARWPANTSGSFSAVRRQIGLPVLASRQAR